MSNQVSFVRLNANNWDLYKEDVMQSEQMFEESLRTDEEEYAAMMANSEAISLVLMVDGQYAGSAVTKKIQLEDRKELHLLDIPETPATLYLHNFVIDAVWQGKGLGKTLMHALTAELKSFRIQKLNGHFRQNGSLATLLKMGGKIIKEEPNWFETGEKFSYCELTISAS